MPGLCRNSDRDTFYDLLRDGSCEVGQQDQSGTSRSRQGWLDSRGSSLNLRGEFRAPLLQQVDLMSWNCR